MSGSRATPGLLLLCALVLVGAFAGTWWLLSGVADDEVSVGRTTSTLTPRQRLEPAVLIDAWARSLEGPYAQTGSITRTRGESIEVSSFRRATSDGRSLSQAGSTAVVVEDGQQRVCEILAPSDIRCGRAEPAPSADQQLTELETALAPRGDYLVYDDPDAGCFVLVFDGAVGLGSRFGQETRLCFDADTGALVSRVQRTGTSVETLETASLVPEVGTEDLEPAFSE